MTAAARRTRRVEFAAHRWTLGLVRELVALVDEQGYPDDAKFEFVSGSSLLAMTRGGFVADMEPQPATPESAAAAEPEAVPVDVPDVEPEPVAPPDAATAADSFVCAECGKSCKGGQGLAAHTRAAHSTQEFRCNWCGRVFRIAAALTRHRDHCIDKPTIGPDPDDPEPEHVEPDPELLAAVAAHLCATCDHARRRHEDGNGLCLICECAGYAAAAS